MIHRTPMDKNAESAFCIIIIQGWWKWKFAGTPVWTSWFPSAIMGWSRSLPACADAENRICFFRQVAAGRKTYDQYGRRIQKNHHPDYAGLTIKEGRYFCRSTCLLYWIVNCGPDALQMWYFIRLAGSNLCRGKEDKNRKIDWHLSKGQIYYA